MGIIRGAKRGNLFTILPWDGADKTLDRHNICAPTTQEVKATVADKHHLVTEKNMCRPK